MEYGVDRRKLSFCNFQNDTIVEARMKKSIIAAVVVFLLTIPVVCAQQTFVPPQGAQEISFRANGNTLMFRSRGGGVSLVLNFEGKLNLKQASYYRQPGAGHFSKICGLVTHR